MKKIFIVFFILICGPVFATSMCVNDDTVVVVLDASINGTGGSHSQTSTGGTGDWNTIFSYGRVYGVSACVSQNYGSVVDEITDNGAIVTGGESNGGFCYCKMLHPAVSRWVFHYSGTAANCAANCAYSCEYNYGGGGLRINALFRMSVFGSVAQ